MTTAIKTKLSVKAQAFAALIAVVSAVALPQIFHAVGAVSGLGTALGETFLPMHLPIILVGLFAGSYAGAAAGAVAPLISFAISGMPRIEMLVFMCIELCAYGLIAGLFRNVKLPTIAKVLFVQIGGRIIRAAAILLAVFAFGNEGVKVSVIWTSLAAGLPGILLQFCVIPLAIYRIENPRKNEK